MILKTEKEIIINPLKIQKIKTIIVHFIVQLESILGIVLHGKFLKIKSLKNF